MNFIVVNNKTAQIDDVTPPVFSIVEGDLPVVENEIIYGIHSGFNNALTVTVSNYSEPCCLTLYKNLDIQQVINVTGNGSYVFSSVSYTNNDVCIIILDNC
jgi:hypothetical protein